MFPLDHGSRQPVACKTCHTDPANYKSYTCYNCHEHSRARVQADIAAGRPVPDAGAFDDDYGSTEEASFDASGRFILPKLLRLEADLKAPGRALVCLMLANNETGIIQPVREVAALVQAADGWLHVDAVQAAGKIPTDSRELGADTLAISAHKLGGPQGVGALTFGPRATLSRIQHGGGQERGRRAGTENLSGIAGFGAAARASDPAQLMQAQMKAWQDYTALWQNTLLAMSGQKPAPVVETHKGDRRFRHEDWQNKFLFDYLKQSYLIASRHMHKAMCDVEGLDENVAKKVDFYTRQYIDALSPSNFALTNPEVLNETVRSGGKNLLKGFSNLLDDLARADGTGLRDYVHVMDLAEGHVAALRQLFDAAGSFTVNLGTGQGTSVLELVRAYDLIPGHARHDPRLLDDRAIVAWGRTTARLGRAMRGFVHPSAMRVMPWRPKTLSSSRRVASIPVTSAFSRSS